MFRFFRDWRRKRYLAHAVLNEEAWGWAVGRIRCASRLEARDLASLRELVTLFLREKEFIPLEGFELRDCHRYAIAVQACMVILRMGIEAYDGWSSIYIFPETFRESQSRPGGLGQHFEAAGLAVQGGGVALAWSEAKRGFADGRDGYNPIIHEFVHKLDMLSGAADGRPMLPPGVTQKVWGETFLAAFEDFRERLDRGGRTRLSSYAATSPAEFFAVLSEVFFEEPEVLADEYPEVMRLLSGFFRQVEV